MLLIMVRKTPTIYMEQPTSLPRTRPLPFPMPILLPALRRTLDAVTVATAETVVVVDAIETSVRSESLAASLPRPRFTA
jgi:hypothetical protein